MEKSGQELALRRPGSRQNQFLQKGQKNDKKSKKVQTQKKRPPKSQGKWKNASRLPKI